MKQDAMYILSALIKGDHIEIAHCAIQWLFILLENEGITAFGRKKPNIYCMISCFQIRISLMMPSTLYLYGRIKWYVTFWVINYLFHLTLAKAINFKSMSVWVLLKVGSIFYFSFSQFLPFYLEKLVINGGTIWEPCTVWE